MSSKHIFTTAEDVPSGAPRQLKFRVVNSSSIVVRWSAPLQEQQDGVIQGYSVSYQKVDDQGNQLNPPAVTDVKYSESENTLIVILTELASETTYQIEVAAYTIKGDGARSVPAFAKTLAKPPDAPFVTRSKPSSSSADVTIKWRTLVSNVLSYKLRYGKSLQRLRQRDQASLKMKEMTFLPSTKHHLFRELDRGVWYLFKVSIRTKVGWSPESPYWVEILPGPPTGPPLEVRASAVSSTTIRVAWLEPDKWKRNGPLTGYSVVYNPLNRRGLSLVRNITNPNQTRVILTGLRMFTEYEIRVRALGQKGPGP
ncbi:hypothetical protein OS493_019058 [Desmophyllum pertusum]|uniref:Fibronectin type-III domain-containing protein n=1 Tax=Desmophyllum pertusum TaxID=174260 RepID=A0A9W9Z3H6_9CNID|nr:hypothetical protein OS493_019058 [Desmophyllum pertusum]